MSNLQITHTAISPLDLDMAADLSPEEVLVSLKRTVIQMRDELRNRKGVVQSISIGKTEAGQAALQIVWLDGTTARQSPPSA